MEFLSKLRVKMVCIYLRNIPEGEYKVGKLSHQSRLYCVSEIKMLVEMQIREQRRWL